MSEIINNREYRQKVLRELIMDLHNGKNVGEVKERFGKLIEGVSPSEISQMEQGLIMEGMPVTEVQRLCDVHAAVFKGSIEQIHNPDQLPGHPLHTFKIENKELEKLINEKIKPAVLDFESDDSSTNINRVLEGFNLLLDIDRHYLRKENLLFPILEKHDIYGPPKVMWGVDDEIRDEIKETISIFKDYNGNTDKAAGKAQDTITKILEMIFKEENILFPMAMETLSEDEWIKIYEESDDIGYCLTGPMGKWNAVRVNIKYDGVTNAEDNNQGNYIRFDTGMLLPSEIGAILNTLPFDITFIDREGSVKYFSRSNERIFTRTKAVIGRSVSNCHPPASVHIVEKLIEDLKTGKKDHEDFWIKMGEIYAYIRYFAVRDDSGQYLGTLEVTQDIKEIKVLEGEKRLMSE